MIKTGELFSLDQYMKEGYSGPIQVLSLEEAAKGYNKFFDTIGQSEYYPTSTKHKLDGWHHRYRWLYELALSESILGPIKQILGDDVILWSMNFWYKEPRNPKRIPWHQDVTYWPMDPPLNATAWISLGYSLTENGCLRIIPGTHNELVNHLALDPEDQAFLNTEIEASLIDERKALDIELSPGQAVFFTEKVFHGSEANTSNIPRVAFTMRFTSPKVKMGWDPVKFPQYRNFLLSGEDKYHYNDHMIGVPPVD